MGKMASALIKIVDCVKRRLLHERDCEEKATCLRQELDKRRDGPVTDPCWTWVPGYISSYQDEMTEWGIQWLGDGAERSKYGGRSYDEVLQDIYKFEMDCKNQKDACNQPAKDQEPQRGLRIAVATRIAAGKGQSLSASSPHDRRVRLSIPFHSTPPSPPPPPCGPGTPDLFARRQDSCAYVPQMVFLNAAPDIRHTRIAVRCSDVRIDFSGQGVVSVAFKSEYTTKLFLDPKWLPYPQGVNVMPSSYKLNTTIAPKARVRLECSDGQTLLAEADGQSMEVDSIRCGHDFSFNLAMPAPGEYTLRSVLMAGWAGRFSVEFDKQAIIDGIFARTLAIDPMNASEGDGSCDIGMFRIVDLRDLSETIRASAYVKGRGTDDDPYSGSPKLVARSPYGFAFNALSDSVPMVFTDHDALLRGVRDVDEWEVISDCKRYKVFKKEIVISPPDDDHDAYLPKTFYLPHVFKHTFAQMMLIEELQKLSDIEIGGHRLPSLPPEPLRSGTYIVNNGKHPVSFDFMSRNITLNPGMSYPLSLGLCDAYAGGSFGITIHSEKCFCDAGCANSATFVLQFNGEEEWKRSFSQKIYVVNCGTYVGYGNGRVHIGLFAKTYAGSEDACFDFEYDINVAIRFYEEFDAVLTKTDQVFVETHYIPCSCDNGCSECEAIAAHYRGLEPFRTSGLVRITKTLRGYGKRVIATYQMDGNEYASLVGIEEIP